MTITNAQADKNPTATKNSGSSIDVEVQGQEAKVKQHEARAWWPNRLNFTLLILAGAIAVFIALNSLWLSRADASLRRESTSLNELRLAKLRIDAQKEENRIEREASERLDNAKRDSDKEIVGLKKIAADAQKDLEAQKGKTATLAKEAAEARTAQLRMEQSLEATKAQTVEALTRANEAGWAAFNEKWEREQMERMSYPRRLRIGADIEYINQLRK